MSRRIDVGFIPLLDAAPLIVALEIGFAAEEGLDLALHREMSWASLRDRLIWGRYHAAHMLAPVVVIWAPTSSSRVTSPTLFWPSRARPNSHSPAAM